MAFDCRAMWRFRSKKEAGKPGLRGLGTEEGGKEEQAVGGARERKLKRERADREESRGSQSLCKQGISSPTLILSLHYPSFDSPLGPLTPPSRF